MFLTGQMFFMDYFLGGEFWSYGRSVLNFMTTDDEGRADPALYVFPRIAQCIVYKHGASGLPQRYSSICALPLNILNGKIYTFLWFWFLVLLTLTSAWFIFTISFIKF
jgi:hypothetical protein